MATQTIPGKSYVVRAGIADSATARTFQDMLAEFDINSGQAFLQDGKVNVCVTTPKDCALATRLCEAWTKGFKLGRELPLQEVESLERDYDLNLVASGTAALLQILDEYTGEYDGLWKDAVSPIHIKTIARVTLEKLLPPGLLNQLLTPAQRGLAYRNNRRKE